MWQLTDVYPGQPKAPTGGVLSSAAQLCTDHLHGLGVLQVRFPSVCSGCEVWLWVLALKSLVTGVRCCPKAIPVRDFK